MSNAAHLKAKVALRQRIYGCEACDLRRKCRAPVPFAGPTPNRLLVVGEAPGQQEDNAGEPFVGPSGRLLRRLLRDAGLDHQTMAWANTVCCFPKGTPTGGQQEACRANLVEQLELIQPFHLLLVGSVALSAFRPDLRITKAHGQVFSLSPKGPVAFPVLHPAAALRDPTLVPQIREDLALWKEITEAFHPFHHLSITCAACGQWVDRYDPDGVAWCRTHAAEGFRGWEKAERWRNRPATRQEVML